MRMGVGSAISRDAALVGALVGCSVNLGACLTPPRLWSFAVAEKSFQTPQSNISITTLTFGMATTPPTVDAAQALLINRRVKCIRPLVSPQLLQEDIPLYVVPNHAPILPNEAICRGEFYFLARTIQAAKTVLQGRHDTERIVRGEDDRLLVVVGSVQLIHEVLHEWLTRSWCPFMSRNTMGSTPRSPIPLHPLYALFATVP
jgi:hypothetical protein